MNINSSLSEGQRVLAVEDEYVAAEISRDEATLRRILGDRFVFNANDGTTSGKAELVESILSWHMTGQTITERSVVVDGDTAVVLGTTELVFASEGQKAFKSLLRYTATYIKRKDSWRMFALHMAKHQGQK